MPPRNKYPRDVCRVFVTNGYCIWEDEERGGCKLIHDWDLLEKYLADQEARKAQSIQHVRKNQATHQARKTPQAGSSRVLQLPASSTTTSTSSSSIISVGPALTVNSINSLFWPHARLQPHQWPHGVNPYIGLDSTAVSHVTVIDPSTTPAPVIAASDRKIVRVVAPSITAKAPTQREKAVGPRNTTNAARSYASAVSGSQPSSSKPVAKTSTSAPSKTRGKQQAGVFHPQNSTPQPIAKQVCVGVARKVSTGNDRPSNSEQGSTYSPSSSSAGSFTTLNEWDGSSNPYQLWAARILSQSTAEAFKKPYLVAIANGTDTIMTWNESAIKPSIPAGAATSFPLFTLLPFELREMVWEHAIDAISIEVRLRLYPTDAGGLANCPLPPTPALFRSNRQSRAVCFRRFETKAFGSKDLAGYAYFRFDRDRLFLHPQSTEDYIPFIKNIDVSERRRVRYLALSLKDLYTAANESLIMETIAKSFRGMHFLYLIASDGEEDAQYTQNPHMQDKITKWATRIWGRLNPTRRVPLVVKFELIPAHKAHVLGIDGFTW